MLPLLLHTKISKQSIKHTTKFCSSRRARAMRLLLLFSHSPFLFASLFCASQTYVRALESRLAIQQQQDATSLETLQRREEECLELHQRLEVL
jgi:hypothetical protein